MTAETFKANPELTKGLRELIAEPVMQQAIAIAKDGNPPVDAPLASPEIYSVRVLSQMSGWNAAIAFIEGLATPAIPESAEPAADWGAELPP